MSKIKKQTMIAAWLPTEFSNELDEYIKKVNDGKFINRLNKKGIIYLALKEYMRNHPGDDNEKNRL